MRNTNLLAISSGSLIYYALCPAAEFKVGDVVTAPSFASPGVVVDIAADPDGECVRMISRLDCIHMNVSLAVRIEGRSRAARAEEDMKNNASCDNT